VQGWEVTAPDSGQRWTLLALNDTLIAVEGASPAHRALIAQLRPLDTSPLAESGQTPGE
jgi:hypothetical protein